jgi:hypothetical protein
MDWQTFGRNYEWQKRNDSPFMWPAHNVLIAMERMLGSVAPPTKQSNAIKAREIACKHCQSLFTLSESIIRIRSGSKKKLSATDAAA